MATNAYCAAADVKSWLQVNDTTDDTMIDGLCGTTSRWIDAYCGERFWLDSGLVARTYEATSRYQLDVAGIGDSTGLLIETDSNGDGIFELAWSATDVELLPVNAPTEGPEAAPWRRLRAVGSKTFPLAFAGLLARRDRVRVTAHFGWPTVPLTVKQATVMQAARWYKRRYSPEGIIGFGDGGALRMTPLDHDVCALLSTYRLGSEAVVLA